MRTRRTFASLLLAVAAFAGCQLESVERIDLTLEGTPKHFIAEFEASTRTAVDAAGKTSWKAGDVIRYYSAAGGAVGTATVEQDCSNADFVANVGNEDSFFSAEYGGTGITNNANGKSFTITNAIPDEQSGRFEDAHVAVSKTYVELGEKPQSITFKNITSLIEFTLERTDVAKVVFKAEGGENLRGNGDINILFKDVVATPSFAGEKDSTIIVNTSGSGTFYISTLPATLEKGFSIECLDTTGVSLGAAVGKKALTLNANTILSLGTIDSRIEKPYEDLSADGTANCYIASKPGGDYKFNATVKGNSYEALDGTPFKVSVLWESFGTAVTPKVGDVVSNVSFADGCIRFTAGQNGNAVIAIKDRDDEILWSWHIWVCEGFDPVATQQEYNNNAGTMMDRNLGATSATPGDVHALGLLYQWGRKDPFLSGCQISYSSWSDQQQAASTLSWPSPVKSDASNGTIAYAVGHPTTFIKYNDNYFDWYYTGSSTTDNIRWQTFGKAKGMYDPCPAGWRVPDGGNNGVWSTAFGTSSYWNTSSNWDDTNKGMDFGSTDKKLGSGSIWYPAAGYLSESVGTPRDVGYGGCYWSCTPNDTYAYDFYFSIDGDVYPSSYNYCARARSVRCVKEGTQTKKVQYVDLGLSVKWATCNLGADSPEEYGRYFAWGDIVGQTWNGSSWSGGGFSSYPSYQLNANNNLKPQYDAAHVNYGGSWRMPTLAECEELINNCTCTWTNNYNGAGVAGRIFTSNKAGYTDKSIFLPAAGYGRNSYLYDAGSYGYYWSSTFRDDYYHFYAWGLFLQGGVGTSYTYYNHGQSVRPVTE